MKNLFVVLIFSIALVSCSGKSESQEQASNPEQQNPTDLLKTEVNQVHDEVMPKMGDLYKLKKRLQEMDTTTGTPPEKKAEIPATIQQLDSAYNGMMHWMHQYKPEQYESDDQELRKYLESEMTKIRQVRDDMLSALEKARSVTGE